MRQLTPLAIVLLGVLASFNASATDAADTSCTLLARDELSGLGVNKDTAFLSSHVNWYETPKEIPDAKGVTYRCMVDLDVPGSGMVLLLSVESFKGKVTEDQVGKWLKAVAEADTNQEGATPVKIGAATCETGSYELKHATLDGSIEKINEIYVACDEQVGTRHVSLNIHAPEANKSALPTLEKTKSILDNSVRRLRENKG
ncbi:MAG: hypothetical protein WC073_03645 [Sterolibacterium sp.]